MNHIPQWIKNLWIVHEFGQKYFIGKLQKKLMHIAPYQSQGVKDI